MNSKKIIRSWFPGIGDHLQHSWMPKVFTEMGYDVYLSDKNTYRNPEIKELVWDKNPYILGETSEEENCGDIPGMNYVCHNAGFLENWQICHGVEPSIKYPQIYYSPQPEYDVPGRTLLDVTATSGQPYYNPIKLQQYIRENYNKKDIMVCLFKDGISMPIFILDGYEMVFVKNIFHYCDMIHACKRFVVLHSGGMVLAAGLQKDKKIEVDCLITSHPVHTVGLARQHHFYDNINYITYD